MPLIKKRRGRLPRPLHVGDSVRAGFKVDKPPPRGIPSRAVKAEWPGKGRRFPGMVAGIHPDGCVDVYFNDGFFETRVLPQHVERAYNKVYREWRTTGHELIGQRVRRDFRDGKGAMYGQIVCWCPAGEVPGEDLSWDETFHVIHSDDDEEALGRDVVLVALEGSSAHAPPPAPPVRATASGDAGSATATAGMAAVRDMLQRFNLSAYECAFEEQGYDDYDYLIMVDHACFEELVGHVGMKPGHAQKFRHYLRAEQSRRFGEAASLSS